MPDVARMHVDGCSERNPVVTLHLKSSSLYFDEVMRAGHTLPNWEGGVIHGHTTNASYVLSTLRVEMVGVKRFTISSSDLRPEEKYIFSQLVCPNIRGSFD